MTLNLLSNLYIFLILFCILFIFLLLLFFYISAIISLMFGAPYIPINKKNIKEILSFGDLSQNDIFYDLGSGDGRVLMSSVHDFNVVKAIGYEIAPWPYLLTLILIKYKKIKKIKLFRKNILKADISNTTFIYLYLFPKMIDQISSKITKEALTETKILCVQFPINVNNHTEFYLLNSKKINNLTIYLYKFKPRSLLEQNCGVIGDHQSSN